MREGKDQTPQTRGSHRRSFLKTMGLAAGAAVVSNPDLPRALANTVPADQPARSGRKMMMLLNASGSRGASPEFVALCESVINAQSGVDGAKTLADTVVRLAHPYQVYFKSVGEAETWLRDNGYFSSLDFYARHDGRTLILFDELNRVTVPQYYTSRRGLAYLAYALRRNYSGGLRTLFPGPSEGLGPKGFYRYFKHYDLLTDLRKPLTFGEAFGKDVDPLVRDKTMLRHGGRGVFDSVSLRYDPNKTYSPDKGSQGYDIPYREWMKAGVDDRFWLYQAERVGAGKSTLARGEQEWNLYAAGKALAPFRNNASHYHVHLVEQG